MGWCSGWRPNWALHWRTPARLAFLVSGVSVFPPPTGARRVQPPALCSNLPLAPYPVPGGPRRPFPTRPLAVRLATGKYSRDDALRAPCDGKRTPACT